MMLDDSVDFLMQRRHFLMAIGAAGAAATGPLTVPARAAVPVYDPRPGRWQRYEVVTRISLSGASQGARAWVPLPAVEPSDWFRPLGDAWSGNATRATVVTDRVYGARMIAARWDGQADLKGAMKDQGAAGDAADGTAQLTVTSRFETRNRVAAMAQGAAAPRLDAASRRFHTAPTELIRTDGIVAETARRVVGAARSDEAKARAIYDWICEQTHRDPKTRGCGLGDVVAMLESGNLGGKCADLNTLFVALARASGLPARDVYGLRVAPSAFGYRSLGAATADVTRAQHCRAEVWLADRGWVAVDPADVRKIILEEPPGTLTLADARVRVARETLFGAWEMNWMPYNRGHDLELVGARGPRIPFLMYPQAETSTGRLDELDPELFRYTITARTLPAEAS